MSPHTKSSNKQLSVKKGKTISTEEDLNGETERFKQTLQWLMEDRQISEAELSGLTGLSPATIHRLIYGITDPKLTTLRAIASFFKIKIEQLIGDYPIPHITQTSSNSDKILFSTPVLVPFIEWDQLAAHIDHINDLTISNWANWHVTTNEPQNGPSFDLFATKLHYTAGNLLHADSILIIKSINKGNAVRIGDCVLGSTKSNTFVGQVGGSGDDISIKGGTSLHLNKCKLYGTVVICEIPCSKISRYTLFI